MSELKAFTFGLGQNLKDGSPCVVAFDDENNPRLASDEKFYIKSEADKVIADLEESHKIEVEQLLMEIVGLKKLVETADKLLKQKGGFMIKDVTFNGVKLEGMKNEP